MQRTPLPSLALYFLIRFSYSQPLIFTLPHPDCHLKHLRHLNLTTDIFLSYQPSAPFLELSALNLSDASSLTSPGDYGFSDITAERDPVQRSTQVADVRTAYFYLSCLSSLSFLSSVFPGFYCKQHLPHGGREHCQQPDA